MQYALGYPRTNPGCVDHSWVGKKGLKSPRDKKSRHEPWWARGGKSLVCDPGSELRLLIGGREKERRR